MKISVVTPLFALSGVPLAQIRFAKALSEAGHVVDLILGQIDKKLNFPPLGRVRLLNLDQPNVRRMLLPLIGHFRKTKPEIVFSAEDHLNVIVLAALYLSGSRAKFSGSSRVTPFDTYSNTPLSKRWVLKQLMRLAMPRADVLTCVSEDMVKQYGEVFRNAPHVCVYNIVDGPENRARMNEPLDDLWFGDEAVPVIVAAGRLAPWKGFQDLILAMKELLKYKAAKLLILGDGPQRAELQALIDDQQLGDDVRLHGYVDNPLKYFSRSAVFALSSHVEGLPNVLVEAMLCGCTPVATDCPTGPREVLRGGEVGYLVPVGRPADMAVALARALENPTPKDVLQSAVTPFREVQVLARHFSLLGMDPVVCS